MNVLLGFLSHLLFVLALIFLVTFLLALLNVKAVLRNHPRKRAAIATFFLFLVFAALAGATEPQQKEQPRTGVVAKAVTPTVKPTQTPTRIPTPTPTKTPVSSPPSPLTNGIGVSLDQITNGLGLNMQPVDGQPNTYLGIFEDKVGSSLRVTGNKQNISKALLNINGLQEAQKNANVQEELNFGVPEFVSNAFPNDNPTRQWVSNTFNTMANNDNETYQEQSNVIDNKKITIKVNKQVGFVEIDIEKN